MGHSPDKGRILVVDNYEDWRKTLRRLLVGEGFEVELATSRQQALDALRAQVFDLIILDVVLEGNRPRSYEGIGLLQEIEPICDEAGTRVVIVSGFQCPDELRERLARSCVIETLDKQFIEIDALLALVQKGVAQARRARLEATHSG
ncbi:MAG TPA: response regulator [Anaerolineae bacterium]|nr:response regulator [Anaerolineae bacterium]